MTTLDQYRKQNGVVYTPRLLADHLAKKVLSFYFNDELKGNNYINNIEKIKIFDPACGNGELLAGIWRSLINSEKLISQITKNTFSPQDILFGVDIDYESTVVTQKLINSLIGPIPQVNKYNTYKTNALIPSNLHSVSDAWKQILFDFGVPNGFDIIIANPPWGADTTSYVNQINSSIYKLMQGQFDSSDLFIELSLQLLKPDGLIAFIIPDSLFARDKKALREYLLKNTEIQYIARLGEGFFQDIARGCVLLIAKNRIPTTTSVVECLRLDPKTRQLILNEQLSFEEADDRYSNKIAQSRFLQNPG